jgi:2-keto-4-pentenoate hydratase/2-oxohepta-3-ene-1,7-dioic acid hydratase in catechol pathway
MAHREGILAYALATLKIGAEPTACIEVDGVFYPIATAAKRYKLAGLGGGLIDIMIDWAGSRRKLDALAKKLADGRMKGVAAAKARLLAPLLYPRKILCAGANYYDHIAEMGVTDTRKEAQRLFFFFKPPRTAVVGPGKTVKKPTHSNALDWEIELAAVIGKRAKDVAEADALDVIAAYTVAIDLSARDLNFVPDSFFKLDWTAGKGQDTCCPMGPKLVPAAFIKDPQDLALRLLVNGEVKQNARTSGMIFSIREQIAHLSKIMTLEPGDVVLTGTPAGVGFPKKTFLGVGDHVDAEIQDIGRLSVDIGA